VTRTHSRRPARVLGRVGFNQVDQADPDARQVVLMLAADGGRCKQEPGTVLALAKYGTGMNSRFINRDVGLARINRRDG
jgi:hypothetical protein